MTDEQPPVKKNKGGRPKGSLGKKKRALKTGGRYAERTDKQSDKDIIALTSTYLLQNFHKFTEDQKLRVALAIQGKAVKQKVEVEGFTFMNLVKMTNAGAPPKATIQPPHQLGEHPKEATLGRLRSESVGESANEIPAESDSLHDRDS
jgi:hypothetical protein